MIGLVQRVASARVDVDDHIALNEEQRCIEEPECIEFHAAGDADFGYFQISGIRKFQIE